MLDQGMILAAVSNALGHEAMQAAFAGSVESKIKPLLGEEQFEVGPSSVLANRRAVVAGLPETVGGSATTSTTGPSWPGPRGRDADPSRLIGQRRAASPARPRRAVRRPRLPEVRLAPPPPEGRRPPPAGGVTRSPRRIRKAESTGQKAQGKSKGKSTRQKAQGRKHKAENGRRKRKAEGGRGESPLHPRSALPPSAFRLPLSFRSAFCPVLSALYARSMWRSRRSMKNS